MTGQSIRSATGGQRRFSRILFGYILSEFLIALACCFVALMMLFLVSDLFDDLEDFLRMKAPITTLCRYFLMLQAGHVVQALPMSMLLAAMYCTATFCRHQEFSTMLASGVSPNMLCLPMWGAAVVCGLIQFGVSEYIEPEARIRAHEIREEIVYPYEDRGGLKQFLSYHNWKQRRDWLFESFSPDGQSAGVIVTQYRADRTPDWELRAESAEYKDGHWRFYNTVKIQFDERGLGRVGPREKSDLWDAPDLKENPGGLLWTLQMQLAENIGVPRIREILASDELELTPRTEATLRTYMYHRMFFPLAGLMAVILGVPMAVTHERGHTFRSFGMALAIMLMFYMTVQVFLVLGKLQLMPAPLAGALPIFIFSLWGIREMRRRW